MIQTGLRPKPQGLNQDLIEVKDMIHCAIWFQVPILWLQRTFFHDPGWYDINHMETSEKEGTLQPTIYKVVWYDETTFMGT